MGAETDIRDLPIRREPQNDDGLLTTQSIGHYKYINTGGTHSIHFVCILLLKTLKHTRYVVISIIIIIISHNLFSIHLY